MKKKRNKACDCDACRYGLDVVMRRQERQMRKYGFVIDMVMDDSTTPTGFNAHTHGLAENLDHLDLQVVMPLPPPVAAGIINVFVNRIKQGERFKAGDSAYLTPAAEVLFVNAVEDERRVLRIILPDEDGNLEMGEMTGDWRFQYDAAHEWQQDASEPFISPN